MLRNTKKMAKKMTMSLMPAIVRFDLVSLGLSTQIQSVVGAAAAPV
jgi:hypothetical protein